MPSPPDSKDVYCLVKYLKGNNKNKEQKQKQNKTKNILYKRICHKTNAISFSFGLVLFGKIFKGKKQKQKTKPQKHTERK